MSEKLVARARIVVVALILALVLLGLAAAPVHAGSVFMKNGYIIQGPIVKQSDQAVILGWNNGEVTIHRRFIESVTYEPGEEERLRAAEEARAEELAATSSFVEEVAIFDQEEDLPADVDVFLKLYGGTEQGSQADGGSNSNVEVVALDPAANAERGGETEVAVESIEPSLASDAVFSRGRELSLRPPKGWRVSDSDEFALSVVGPKGVEEDAVVPSLSIVALERGPLTFEDCSRLLSESDEEVLTVAEPLTEGKRRLAGGQEVYERLVRGAIEDKTLVVRQVLVPQDDVIWLITGFSKGANEDPSFALVEQAISTLTFTETAAR